MKAIKPDSWGFIFFYFGSVFYVLNCVGLILYRSFEEMEAQISQGKSPVLPPRGARDSMASEKSRKMDSQSRSRTQSNERDGVVSANQSNTKRISTFKSVFISLAQIIWSSYSQNTRKHNKCVKTGLFFYFVTNDCTAYLIWYICNATHFSFQS